jgi:hypothetical protein
MTTAEDQALKQGVAKIAQMQRQLDNIYIQRGLMDNTRPITPAEAEIRKRLELPFRILNEGLMPPLPATGENTAQFHLRVLNDLWKKTPSQRVEFARDADGLRRVEKEILGFADKAIHNLPAPVEIKHSDHAGRVISEFYGSTPKSWLKQFMAPGMRMERINGIPIEDLL